jgi:hypothetical protein
MRIALWKIHHGIGKMSLPTGRGDQRVRSCGRVSKLDDAGKLLGMQRSGRDIVSTIGVLLREARTGCSGGRGHGCECRAEEKVCQDNILGGNCGIKKGGIQPWRLTEMGGLAACIGL